MTPNCCARINCQCQPDLRYVRDVSLRVRISDYMLKGDFGSANGKICHGKRELMLPVPCTISLARGIGRRYIFNGNKTKGRCFERQRDVVSMFTASASAHGQRSDRICYAPASDRLCGAFQSRFQRDHRWHEHLFQNRYKSILCEEDRYLRQLVAYMMGFGLQETSAS